MTVAVALVVAHVVCVALSARWRPRAGCPMLDEWAAAIFLFACIFAAYLAMVPVNL